MGTFVFALRIKNKKTVIEKKNLKVIRTVAFHDVIFVALSFDPPKRGRNSRFTVRYFGNL